MEKNFFDEYNVVDDIKFLILLLVEENEIHWIMSNVDRQWHSLCTSTFVDNRFDYKFIKYYQKILNLNIKDDTEKQKKLRAMAVMILQTIQTTTRIQV